MEDPVGWHPETTSEFPFKSELQQKIEDHTHQGLRLLYENQDNIEIKEKVRNGAEITGNEKHQEEQKAKQKNKEK